MASISLVTIGNIRSGSGVGAIESLVKQQLVDKIKKQDRAARDVLHNAIEVNPATGEIIKDSLGKILIPANAYLASLVSGLSATLNNPDSFPASVLSPGLKTVQAPLPVRSSWAALSKAYLRKIGALPGKRGVTAANKRFWYERRRSGAKNSKAGLSLGEGAAADLLPLAARIKTGFTGSKAQSTAGRDNVFTISNTLKRRKARTHARKGLKQPIYGVTGELLGPRKLTVGSDFSKEFTKLSIGSLLSGTPVVPEVKGGRLFSNGEADWVAILLANELKRPWVAKYFSKGRSELIAFIQNELLSK